VSEGRQGWSSVRIVLLLRVVCSWFLVCRRRIQWTGREERSSEVCMQYCRSASGPDIRGSLKVVDGYCK
jgi:hypothetical protein